MTEGFEPDEFGVYSRHEENYALILPESLFVRSLFSYFWQLFGDRFESLAVGECLATSFGLRACCITDEAFIRSPIELLKLINFLFHL